MKKETYKTSKWSLKEPLYLKKTDKRYKRHVNQLKRFGFSNSETWSLRSVVAQFVLPRLIKFKEIKMCFPADISEKEWDIMLDKMIFSFKWLLEYEDDFNIDIDKKQQDINWEKCKEGMNLFSERFFDLWW